MKKNATAAQLEKLILRMMPNHISRMGEERLIAAIIGKAWDDSELHSSKVFFTEVGGFLDLYCDKCGLNAQQIREIFIDHNAEFKKHMAALQA